MSATREADYSGWQGATAGPSGADADLSRDTGVVARGAAASGAVLSMALVVMVLIAGAGMAAILLLFMGQVALFTYLRPFLETLTKVDVTVLSLLLLAIGVAGLIGTSLNGPLLNPYACVLSLVVALGLPYPLAAQRAERGSPMGDALSITIGDKAFNATLSDNSTAAAFKALLPLSVSMSELNGNEKLYRLPTNLPAQPSRPASIQNGDLMLYGASTVVLFYKSFATTYSYTRIGRIDDPAGLERAVGTGSVTVTFALRHAK